MHVNIVGHCHPAVSSMNFTLTKPDCLRLLFLVLAFSWGQGWLGTQHQTSVLFSLAVSLISHDFVALSHVVLVVFICGHDEV